MKVNECIKLIISFGGHYFELIAYLVDMLDDFQLVIGSKSMFELEADVKFSNLTFEFAQRSIELIPTKYYCCPPHQSIDIKFKMTDSPLDFFGGSVVAKMYTSRPDKLPQALRFNVVNRKVNIKLFNESDEPVHFYKRHKVGCLDMRSTGYFFKSRADIAKTLGNHAMFLIDQETINYMYPNCKL